MLASHLFLPIYERCFLLQQRQAHLCHIPRSSTEIRPDPRSSSQGLSSRVWVPKLVHGLMYYWFQKPGPPPIIWDGRCLLFSCRWPWPSWQVAQLPCPPFPRLSPPPFLSPAHPCSWAETAPRLALVHIRSKEDHGHHLENGFAPAT